MASQVTTDHQGKHICVLGAGIVGLSTAQSLRRRGYQVSILASEHPLSSTSTSQGAGGLWEPFECEPKALVNKWAMETLNQYQSFLKLKKSFVEVVPVIDLFNYDEVTNRKLPPDWSTLSPFFKFQTLKVQEMIALGNGKTGSYQWKDISSLKIGEGDSYNDRNRKEEYEEEEDNNDNSNEYYAPFYCWDNENIPPGWFKYTDCFLYHSIVMNSPEYLKSLLNEFESDPGVNVYIGSEYFFNSLLEASQFVHETLHGEALVNCTGLGSGPLCQDEEMVAGRGGIAMFKRYTKNQCKNGRTMAGKTDANSSGAINRGEIDSSISESEEELKRAEEEGEGGGGGGGGNDVYETNAVLICDEPPLGSHTQPGYVIPRGDIVVVGGSFLLQSLIIDNQRQRKENVFYNSCIQSNTNENQQEEDIIDAVELNRLYRNYNELSFRRFNNKELDSNVDDTEESALIKTWIGKRPVRKAGVRVEYQEKGNDDNLSLHPATIPVFHNYGHGGSGWTIHHGSAEYICDIIDDKLSV